MVHTLAPWTSRYKLTKIFSNIDNAELAARLGSPNLFDRRGSIVFMDDFEATPFNWAVYSSGGAGGAAVLSNTKSFTGSQSVKMTTPNSSAEFVRIHKNLQRPIDGRMGLEFTFQPNSEIDYYRITMMLYETTIYYASSMQIDVANEKLQYTDSAGAWQDAATGVKLRTESTIWYTWKYVIDLSTHNYVRSMLGKNETDLSTYSLASAGYAGNPYLYASFLVYNGRNANDIIYIDNCIITQEEP